MDRKLTARFSIARIGSLVGFAAMLTAIAAAQTATQTPVPPAPIYPDVAVATDEIKAALVKATKEHKRIILDFGGNWCGDCKALDSYFHKAPNADLLAKNFVLVDVNIGHVDKNLDIAKKYGVPLELGVPALAVLDEKGNVVFSQKHGEFESMRRMDPTSVTKFLEQWKRGSAPKPK